MADITNPDSDLVRVDPNPEHFHSVRYVLFVEGAILAVLGIWGLIAAWNYHGSDPTGALVLVFRFTVTHAAVLLGTGLLAFLATTHRRVAMIFMTVQAIAYGLMFITSGGVHNSYSNLSDAILHGVVAATGLAMVMWTAARAMDGYHYTRPSGGGGTPIPH